MPALRVEHLTRRFGDVAAVDDVSLDVAAGAFLVLLGPSGCGKTTLLRMIAGLLAPTSGRIVLGDRDVTHLAPRDRDLAMVFQSYALYPHLSVARNLGFGLRARRRPRGVIERRVAEASALLDLEALLDRKPKELSGGQRQRVALGRAIVREPAAFLMDEPLSNLDAKLRAATRTELIELHRRLATTFVYVTHDQIDAMTMATRVAVLDGGRVEQVGSPVEVYDEPASAFVAGFLGSPPMNLLPARLSDDGGVLHVRASGVDIALWPGTTSPRDVLLGVRPEHLAAVPPEHPGPCLHGTVGVVENLGSEEVATCTVEGARVALRGARPLGLHSGRPVTLSMPLEHLHLFDAGSGRRLVWAGGDPRSAAPAQTVATA